jgi:translation initiation factor 1 (eIF-1/SUI1)
MRIADLSKEELAQLAVAIKARMTTKGRYTELVESIDRRLSNIERMVAKLASDEKPKRAPNPVGNAK